MTSALIYSLSFCLLRHSPGRDPATTTSARRDGGKIAQVMDRATVRSSPGGDHRSLQAIVRSRENEKKVLELCLRGATGAQAADAVGLSESGVSRALNRALKRIGQPEAEQVRQRMMEELAEAPLRSLAVDSDRSQSGYPARAAGTGTGSQAVGPRCSRKERDIRSRGRPDSVSR